jgi:hypothetical protein
MRNMTITIAQTALYRRIQQFSFDDGPVAYPFHCRLAKDNNWSSGYTARVITEYRRFTLLAISAGHPVSPSDQVDQAWHLHLLHTESYWDRFCGETLGRPLHHQPTKGGSHELSKFNDWYAKTLASYSRFFDGLPPADIWPMAHLRFDEERHLQRINSQHYWIISKPWHLGARL